MPKTRKEKTGNKLAHKINSKRKGFPVSLKAQKPIRIVVVLKSDADYCAVCETNFRARVIQFAVFFSLHRIFPDEFTFVLASAVCGAWSLCDFVRLRSAKRRLSRNSIEMDFGGGSQN